MLLSSWLSQTLLVILYSHPSSHCYTYFNLFIFFSLVFVIKGSYVRSLFTRAIFGPPTRNDWLYQRACPLISSQCKVEWTN